MQKRLPLPTGTVLQGRYRILRQLGHGGFGAVYEAVDDEIGKSFALKETFYAANEELSQAFKREARMLASLEHEAFPDVSHYFTEGDGCFLVMELIRGDDLDKLLSQRSLPFDQQQVLTWAGQILDALQDLHSHGIIHRDIKPSNLKLTPKGKIKLLDFGIAKGALEGESTVMTTVGSLAAATIQYAPLEQVLKASWQYQQMLNVVSTERVAELLKQGTTAASDLYAFAATLYHLLTRQLPADSATRALAIWSGQQDRLIPAHQLNPQVSPEVSEVLMKAMRLDRSERYQSASEMHSMLTAAGTPSATPNQLAATLPMSPVQETQPPPGPSVPEAITTDPSALENPTKQIRPVTHKLSKPKSWKRLYLGAGVGVVLLITLILIAWSGKKPTSAVNSESTVRNSTTIAGSKYVLAQTLEQNNHVIYSLAFSPDGKTVASNSRHNTIKIWDTNDGTLKQTFEGFTSTPYQVAFSPDGKTIAGAGEDTTIKLWDVFSGILKQTLHGHSDAVISLAFSPDGKTIASGSRDLTVKLWDAADGTLKYTLTGNTRYVIAVRFSPDSATIASGEIGPTPAIRLWDVETGNLKQTITGHVDSLNAIAFSPDSKTIASGSDDKTIKLWDAVSGTLNKTITTQTAVQSIAFMPGSRTIVCANDDYSVGVWDVSGVLKQKLTGHSGRLYSVAISPDGNTIASGGYDLTIKLWRLKYE